MNESKAKVIERNRPPRVQITYEVFHDGSATTIELPFVMGVMAGLAGASQTQEAKKPVRDRSFVEVDAGKFPELMGALAPRVKARVKNTLPKEEGKEGDEELAIDVTFRSMGGFAPDQIAEQVPQLAELLRMRRQLVELLGMMDGRPDAEKRIAQLLNSDSLLRQIATAAIGTETATAKEG